MKQGNGDVAKTSLPADFSKDQLAKAQTVIYFQLPKGGSVLAPSGQHVVSSLPLVFCFIIAVINITHSVKESAQKCVLQTNTHRSRDLSIVTRQSRVKMARLELENTESCQEQLPPRLQVFNYNSANASTWRKRHDNYRRTIEIIIITEETR